MRANYKNWIRRRISSVSEVNTEVVEPRVSTSWREGGRKKKWVELFKKFLLPNYNLLFFVACVRFASGLVAAFFALNCTHNTTLSASKKKRRSRQEYARGSHIFKITTTNSTTICTHAREQQQKCFRLSFLSWLYHLHCRFNSFFFVLLRNRKWSSVSFWLSTYIYFNAFDSWSWLLIFLRSFKISTFKESQEKRGAMPFHNLACDHIWLKEFHRKKNKK